jgi:hypothetical protein
MFSCGRASVALSSNRGLRIPENICFALTSLGHRMNNSLFSIPLTHLRMESCSLWSFDYINILERLAGTLQMIELVDVAFWCHTCPVANVGLILHSFKHDLRLRTLVLDGLRAMDRKLQWQYRNTSGQGEESGTDSSRFMKDLTSSTDPTVVVGTLTIITTGLRARSEAMSRKSRVWSTMTLGTTRTTRNT